LGTSSYPEAGDCRVTELTGQNDEGYLERLVVYARVPSAIINFDISGSDSRPCFVFFQNLHLHLQQLPGKSARVCPEAKEWESEISSDWITPVVI
jgi:hypothetical protein